MEKRRTFIRQMAWLAAGITVLFNPFFSLVRTLYAQTKRIILPKDTELSTLKNRNPRTLDTTNLETTPIADFDTMGLTEYEVDLPAWRLKISGMIDAPVDLTYDQLLKLPANEQKVLLICPGVFAYNAKYKGVSMKALFEKFDVKEGADQVTFSGPEGNSEKSEPFPLKAVLADNVFLAYAINDKPLPQKHGFPLRVVARDHFGGDWVKYVYRMKIGRS